MFKVRPKRAETSISDCPKPPKNAISTTSSPRSPIWPSRGQVTAVRRERERESISSIICLFSFVTTFWISRFPAGASPQDSPPPDFSIPRAFRSQKRGGSQPCSIFTIFDNHNHPPFSPTPTYPVDPKQLFCPLFPPLLRPPRNTPKNTPKHVKCGCPIVQTRSSSCPSCPTSASAPDLVH